FSRDWSSDVCSSDLRWIDPGESFDGANFPKTDRPYDSKDPWSDFRRYDFSSGFEVDVWSPTTTRLGDELSIFCWAQIVGSELPIRCKAVSDRLCQVRRRHFQILQNVFQITFREKADVVLQP